MSPATISFDSGGSRASIGAWARGLFAVGLVAFLLLSTTSCTNRVGRSGAVRSEADVSATVESRTIAELASLLCEVYADWPPLGADAEAITRLTGRVDQLTAQQREGLREIPMAVEAARSCPGTIPRESLSQSAELPRPHGVLDGIPGLFDAAEDTRAEVLGARFEWTAIGLGCLSFKGGTDEALRAEADRFLESMGFTLDTYVQTSLARDDAAMSERIFAATLACGSRAGDDLDATPPSAP